MKGGKKNWKNSKAYKELDKSLTDNLEARGLSEKIYADKKEEYLRLWIQLQKLHEDIEERGVTVEDPKRGMLVENRSVVLEIQVSRQMLAIYAALGFKDIGTKASADEEEDYGL